MSYKNGKWVVTICLVGLCLSAFFLLAHGQEVQSAGSSNKRVQLTLAARTADGLHKAALLNNGRYIQIDSSTPWSRASSIEEVVQDSSKILVGVVQNTQPKLIDEGRNIVTHCMIRVDQVLKGNVQVGQTIDFVQRGGSISFDDGSTAAVVMSKEPSLLTDHRYMLFAEDSKEGQYLRSDLADQGVFELNLDGRSVRPHATDSWDKLRAMKNLTQDQFIARVRGIIQTQVH